MLHLFIMSFHELSSQQKNLESSVAGNALSFSLRKFDLTRALLRLERTMNSLYH